MSRDNTSSTKTCFKCGEAKPRSEFYKHPQMFDGLLGKCKQCARSDVAKHRSQNIDAIRAYDRARAKTKERKELNARVTKAWRAEDSRRLKCHNAVRRAIASGSLLSKPCENCDNKNTVAHHDDYDKPLQVRWFCSACHAQHHSRNTMENP